MTQVLAAGVGLLAGIHTATWGMYKDAPHEGFSTWKYSRSILLATVIAVVVSAVWRLDPRQAGDLVVLFGATYAVERALAEIYKTFLRDEDQSKYFIPMQFAVFGKVVRSRGARLLAGAGYVAVLLGMVVLVSAVERSIPDPMPVWLVVAIGGLGGWISAFGGAWKDAPKEGFQIFKFFRSPDHRVAVRAGALLSQRRPGPGDPGGDRLLRGDDRDVQDILLPQRAARQIRGDAGAFSGHAAQAAAVHFALCGDLGRRARGTGDCAQGGAVAGIVVGLGFRGWERRHGGDGGLRCERPTATRFPPLIHHVVFLAG